MEEYTKGQMLCDSVAGGFCCCIYVNHYGNGLFYASSSKEVRRRKAGRQASSSFRYISPRHLHSLNAGRISHRFELNKYQGLVKEEHDRYVFNVVYVVCVYSVSTVRSLFSLALYSRGMVTKLCATHINIRRLLVQLNK